MKREREDGRNKLSCKEKLEFGVRAGGRRDTIQAEDAEGRTKTHHVNVRAFSLW
jgi:hypothetical protein